MKKKIFIVVGILLLIGIIYFVCFYRGTTGDNKKTLTVAEEITLNDNEKELLAELVNVNNQLLNPKQEENTNTTDYVEVAKPTEPVALKTYLSAISVIACVSYSAGFIWQAIVLSQISL